MTPSDDSSGDSEASQAQELKDALELMQQLHKENSEVKANFEQLKAYYLDLTTAHATLKQEHAALREERDQVERQYQQLCDGWRIELESKQAAFDEARSHLLTPRDVELLRAKLLDEVEHPFKAKCDALAKEAESAQENFVKLRREHEAFKLQADAKAARLQHQLANAQAEHRGRVSELQAQLQAAEQTAAGLQDGSNAARQALRVRDEQLARIRHLQTEVDDVRAERDRTARERAAAIAAADERCARLQASQLEAQSALATEQARVRALEAELRDAGVSNNSLASRVLTLQQQVNTATSALAAVTAQHESELAAAEQRAEAAQQEHERALEKQQQEAADADRRAHDQLASCKAELELLRAETSNKIALSEEPLRNTIAFLEADLRGERSAVMAEKQARKHDEAAFKQQVHALESSVHELRQEAADARAEASRLHEEHVRLLSANGVIKAQLESKLATLHHLEENATAISGRCKALEEANASVAADMARMASEAQAAAHGAAEARAQLEQARKEHTDREESARLAWQAEKTLLSTTAAEAASAMQERLESALRRAKQQTNSLSEELLKTRETSALLHVQLAEAQAELMVFKQFGGSPASQQAGPGRHDFGSDQTGTVGVSLTQLRAQLADLRTRQDVYLNANAQSVVA